MPAKPILDPNTISFDNLVADRDGIYALNPHRYEFMLLDGIIHMSMEDRVIVGYRDVKADEFIREFATFLEKSGNFKIPVVRGIGNRVVG